MHLLLVILVPVLGGFGWIVSSRYHGSAAAAFLFGLVGAPVAYLVAVVTTRPLFRGCSAGGDAQFIAWYAVALIAMASLSGASTGAQARRKGIAVPRGLGQTVGTLAFFSLLFVMVWPCG